MLLLGALTVALALPSHALAGTYRVEVCTQAANDSGDLIIGNASGGGSGFEVKRECGQPFGGIRLLGRPVLAPDGKTIPDGSGKVFRLSSPVNLTIAELEADRAFTPTGDEWLARLTWGLRITGVRQIEQVQGRSAPPKEHLHPSIGASSVEGELTCPFAQGCSLEGEVDFSNIIATMEDTSNPTIKSITTPSPTDELRGTVQIPYKVEDTGAGFAEVQLLLDFEPGKGFPVTVATDQDRNGGKCEPPYKQMVPCELHPAERHVDLDTTQIPDGTHKITPFFIDGADNEKVGDTFQITVHNAPTSLQRPALGGTAKVGEKLSVSEGQWEASTDPLAYQWLRCPANVADKSEAGCTAIAGATASDYTAIPKDATKRLVAKVTATNSHGSESALSAPSAPVSETGGGEERHEGNAPQTKLAKHPRKKTALRAAKFTFTSDQPGSAFQCKLDKGPFKSCRSPFKHKVRPGRHSFQVRALNSAGVADPTPAKFSWRVS